MVHQLKLLSDVEVGGHQLVQPQFAQIHPTEHVKVVLVVLGPGGQQLQVVRVVVLVLVVQRAVELECEQ